MTVVKLDAYRKVNRDDALTADIAPLIPAIVDIVVRHRLGVAEARKVFAAVAQACCEHTVLK